MTELVRRIAGFLGIPLLGAIAPFLILPILSRVAGVEGWADISAAQAIGTLGAIAVTFGWGIFGPVAVATTDDHAVRQQYYRDSLWVRSIVFVVVAPIAAGLTLLVIGPHFALDSIIMAVATSAAGLAPGWYCIGIGRPGQLAVYDALPKLGAALLAVPLLIATGWIWTYPVLILIATVVSLAVFSRMVLRGFDPPKQTIANLRQSFRQTLSMAAIDAAGNAYGSTPIPIATASLGASDAAAYSSADRTYRIGLTVVIVTLGNAFQGWVLSPDSERPRQRQLIAIVTHAVVGLIGAVLLATLGPWATSVVFGASVAATQPAVTLYGVAFFFISVSTPFIRNLLIPARRGRFVLACTMATSIVGIVIMAVGAINSSATVIAFGLALSEILIVALMVGPAVRLLRAIPAVRVVPSPPAGEATN